MIKTIIRKTCSPIQVIFDAIRHQQKKRLMMSYALEIHPKQNCCASRNEISMKNSRVKQYSLPCTAINGA